MHPNNCSQKRNWVTDQHKFFNKKCIYSENEYQQAASTSTFVNDADDDIESVISEDSCDSNESDCTMYEPSEHETSADESDISSNNKEADENNTLQESRKFIVFESTLLMLFTVCQLCQESAKGVVRCVIGTMIIIEQLCVACGHRRVWHSQPYMGRSPAGNILLSAAILFTGSSVRKAIRLFNQLNVCTITSRTFFRHQTKYLQPSIISYWKTKQSELIDLLRNSDQELVLGGDGRCDSPGHSAKYGSYTLMDACKRVVLDVQLVQCNEIGSSNNMELEGLKRGLQYIEDQQITVTRIITDRHLQITKWIREKHSEIDHRFDVWHVAKSVGKKLDKLAKEKECGAAAEWRKSATNHMYYTAMSTKTGDGKLMVAKWLSLQ
jgi:solute carrier family 8 (sodium/calcium exchanger)